MRLLGGHDPPQPSGMVIDDRLRLIFTCCHPALDPAARVALTLRALCGLTTGSADDIDAALTEWLHAAYTSAG